MPGELILYESRAPQLWQPGCAAIGVLIGIAAIATGQLGGIALVVVSGLSLAVSVAWYRQRPERLTLDEAGFTVAHGAYTVRCLWPDVTGARVIRGRGRPGMHIELRTATLVTYAWRKAVPGSSRPSATASTLARWWSSELPWRSALPSRSSVFARS